MFRPALGGELLLELHHFGAEDLAAAFDDAENGGVDIFFDALALGLEINEGEGHGKLLDVILIVWRAPMPPAGPSASHGWVHRISDFASGLLRQLCVTGTRNRIPQRGLGMTLNVVALAIPDVKLVTPQRFGDARGFFSETWQRDRFREAGLDFDFMQDNHSLSRIKGTVRGLHFQSPPFAQTKLVRVVRGSIVDIAVDVRRGSPTYGKWVKAELSADNGVQILVPRGFLHGFATLEPDTEIAYKVDNPYSRECDGAMRWNDPSLAIDWGIPDNEAVLSDKDALAPAFADFETPF